MPYIVNNSDGSLTVTVADNTVDTSTYSLALIGRNVSNYGQFFAQNTIRHLENFASSARPNPTQALIGQQWYDKTENIMRVYDGTTWKRSTGVVVAPEANRPASDLGSGGASFFNQTISKLQVHDGSSWRDASYAGTVTNAFADDVPVNSPTQYGARVRTLFLKEEGSERWHPVLALSYVKDTSDTSTAANRGATDVGGQRETIMSLWSDVEFVIASDTETPVDGQDINFQPELVAAGVGIASSRFGRSAGQILKGMNTRAEYEDSDIAVFNQIFINDGGSIGSAGDPVPEGHFDDLIVHQHLTANSAVINNDLTVSGNFVTDGDVTAATGTGTFASLSVTGDAQFAGNAVFDGPVVFNSSTPLAGEDANFSGNVSIGNLTVTGDTELQGLTVNEDLVVNGTTTLNGATTIDANVTINENLTVGDTIVAQTLEVDDISVDTAVTAPVFNGNVSGTTGSFTGNVSANNFNGTFNGNLNGTASQATYADLAEKYTADQEYTAGTVVKLGGSAEITQTSQAQDVDVFGVISTDPAYLMNSAIDGLPVAMTGRVPVRVTGKIAKGDRLTSADIAGHAQSLPADQYDPRIVIGRALEDHTGGEGIIEMVIGVK